MVGLGEVINQGQPLGDVPPPEKRDQVPGQRGRIAGEENQPLGLGLQKHVHKVFSKAASRRICQIKLPFRQIHPLGVEVLPKNLHPLQAVSTEVLL